MRVLLTGGGTGGHVLPALGLWKYMRQEIPGCEFLYIGGAAGLERDLVQRTDIPFVAIPAAGLRREVSVRAARTAWLTWRGYRRARRLISEFQPQVVIGTGGYVTLPVVYAARRLHIPAIVWEANARPGLTNQLCARQAYAVAVSFRGAEQYFPAARRVVYTGNPRASEVLETSAADIAAARAAYQVDARRQLIVCYFGSRGSQTVNQTLLELVPRFAQSGRWQLVYVTGQAHFQPFLDAVAARWPQLVVPDHVQILPFAHDLASLLPLANVVVTRAGGATLAEICALGLPSILVPSPYVTANHQEENARRLVDAGAARMLRERELTADELWQALRRILDEGQGATLRDAARQLATPTAVGDLCALVCEAAGTTPPPA